MRTKGYTLKVQGARCKKPPSALSPFTFHFARSWRRPVVLILGAVLLTGCASWPKHLSERPCCIDTKLVIRKQPIWWHLFDVTVMSQIEQGFHLVRAGRKLFRVPVRSINLKAGKVTDSIFFTDRPIEALSQEDVRWGPTPVGDLPEPPYTITKLKMEGKTAGFYATDGRGVRYLVKLDPAEAPELLSGAEVVASKLLYALGYHVPSYEVAWMAPEDILIAPDAKITDSGGKPIDPETAREALLENRVKNGKMRVAVSRILEGEILGPMRFKRFKDCVEIRGLKLAYAWLNNIDSKDHNSLLVWDGTQTVGYLIDFGTALGADAGRGGPKNPCAGWTHIVDLKVFSMELLTLGLYQSGCDRKELPINPRVGLFSKRLEPLGWKPYAPNLAFEEMNNEDGQWIAERIARLSDEQLSAAVEAGQYSDPRDAETLVEILKARRRPILEAYQVTERNAHDSAI